MSLNEPMYINWQEMIKPEKVQFTTKPAYGKFVCEPLERGFGITIGNALRRIILSSLYGAAAVSVKFDTVMHEFSCIPGVLEDVSEIILNIKEVHFRLADLEPRTVRIDTEGAGELLARAIISDEGKCEVLNPDLHIATLSEKTKLKMDINVKVGKGYSLAEANKDEDAPIGTIPIDAFEFLQLFVYFALTMNVRSPLEASCTEETPLQTISSGPSIVPPTASAMVRAVCSVDAI